MTCPYSKHPSQQPCIHSPSSHQSHIHLLGSHPLDSHPPWAGSHYPISHISLVNNYHPPSNHHLPSNHRLVNNHYSASNCPSHSSLHCHNIWNSQSRSYPLSSPGCNKIWSYFKISTFSQVTAPSQHHWGSWISQRRTQVVCPSANQIYIRMIHTMKLTSLFAHPTICKCYTIRVFSLLPTMDNVHMCLHLVWALHLLHKSLIPYAWEVYQLTPESFIITSHTVSSGTTKFLFLPCTCSDYYIYTAF